MRSTSPRPPAVPFTAVTPKMPPLLVDYLSRHPAPSLPAPSSPAQDSEMASEPSSESEDALTERSSSPSSDASSSADDDFTVVGKKRARKANAKASQAKAAKTGPAPSPLAAKPATPPVAAKSAPSPASPAPPTAKGRSTPSAPKSNSPPPIYLQDKGKWTEVSAWCTEHHVSFLNARSVKDGIKISVPSVSDFRALTKMLQGRVIPFHTFTLPEERVLRAVIRRVPVELLASDIAEDLRAQGIPAIEVHRMHRAKGHMPYDMIMVVAEKTADSPKRLFNLKSVCRLSGIKIEPPRKNGSVGQCHRCQLYGHSQRNCFARPRCVKCLGDHATAECPRPKDHSKCPEPPSCVLCGEKGHPANYRGCPKAPKSPPKAVKRAVARAPLPPPPAPAQTRLSPQRPSVWNKLHHQSAFPALAPQASPAPTLLELRVPPPPLMALNIPPPPPQRSQPSRAAPAAGAGTTPSSARANLAAAEKFALLFDFDRIHSMVDKISACKSIHDVYAIHVEFGDQITALKSLRAGK